MGEQDRRVTEAAEISVLIVDDHEVVRDGLRLALRSAQIRIAGEAADGETAVSLAERRRPDVILMDLRLPQMDGIDTIEAIIRRVPDAKLLIFPAYAERALVQRCFESGARGYILKDASHDALLDAIYKVAAGETYLDSASMAALREAPTGKEVLTTREREVLQLVAEGMSNADISAKLFITHWTVQEHVDNIMAKLGAETRTQAVAIALREATIS